MQPRLTTQRLALTPLTAEDGPQLAVIFAGAGVRRYLFDNDDVSPETVTTIVADNMRRATEGLGLWLIAADGAVIGCIGLHRVLPSTVKAFPPLDGEIELAIALMEDHWGAGYASEALTTALTYASDILHARRIVVLIHVPNERSHALFQRCGFKEIGSCQGSLYPAIAYERTT